MDLIQISERVSTRVNALGFENTTMPEQCFHAIWTLEADVNNGGFDQYFFNSAGDYAHLAPVALRTIGARHAADLVEQAGRVFGDRGPPQNRADRQVALTELSPDDLKTLDELNTRFFAYPDNIAKLLEAYVDANRSSFK